MHKSLECFHDLPLSCYKASDPDARYAYDYLIEVKVRKYMYMYVYHEFLTSCNCIIRILPTALTTRSR